MATSVEGHRLERNAVGLAPTLFQSITHMAPGAAVAFSIIVGVPYAGGSIPLAVLLALVACLLVAVSIGQLARHLPSAGGLYTFSSRGLHPYIGVLVAWGFMLAEPPVAPLPYLIFGNELAAILAFIGFEASLPLAEEVKEPRKTIPRAVFLSALLIGLFYLFCYYAATVYFGPSKMADPKNGFVFLNGGDPWSGLAQAVWGPGLIIVILAVLNSAIANSNAGANAATRVGYSLARIGLLPRALARIHPRFRTPYVAVNVQAIGGIVLALALGWATGGPLSAFALLGTIATIIVICIYILTNVSNLVFHWREKRAEFNPLLNLIVPVLGTLIFLPALVAAFGIDFAGLGIGALSPPANLAPIVIAIWMLAGVVALVYFLRTDRSRITDTGRIFLE